jgi:hypothetical protein
MADYVYFDGELKAILDDIDTNYDGEYEGDRVWHLGRGLDKHEIRLERFTSRIHRLLRQDLEAHGMITSAARRTH